MLRSISTDHEYVEDTGMYQNETTAEAAAAWAKWAERRFLTGLPEFLTHVGSELTKMEERKDKAYEERNRVVALLARLLPSGLAKTAIEGWSEEWHNCVYINTPVGQLSWHIHDSQMHLFEGLPPYVGEWDGHTTEVKYDKIESMNKTFDNQRNSGYDVLSLLTPVAGSIYKDNVDKCEEAPAPEKHDVCKKCYHAMIPSTAIQQTFVTGSSDFPGEQTRGITVSPGGPGTVIDCLKCENCGWSITALPHIDTLEVQSKNQRCWITDKL